jgi:hypothetical protein
VLGILLSSGTNHGMPLAKRQFHRGPSFVSYFDVTGGNTSTGANKRLGFVAPYCLRKAEGTTGRCLRSIVHPLETLERGGVSSRLVRIFVVGHLRLLWRKQGSDR